MQSKFEGFDTKMDWVIFKAIFDLEDFQNRKKLSINIRIKIQRQLKQ